MKKFEIKGMINKHVSYEKEFGKGLFCTRYEIEQYDLDNGFTYIVVPTETIQKGFIKKALDDFITKWGIKVK